jgi:dUTPase
MLSAAPMQPTLFVKKLSEYAQLPSRGSKGAAGYDLRRYFNINTVPETVSSPPKADSSFLQIYLSLFLPVPMAASLLDLGWQLKTSSTLVPPTHAGAGVVDMDYRGPLGVVLFNFGEQDFVGMPNLTQLKWATVLLSLLSKSSATPTLWKLKTWMTLPEVLVVSVPPVSTR